MLVSAVRVEEAVAQVVPLHRVADRDHGDGENGESRDDRAPRRSALPGEQQRRRDQHHQGGDQPAEEAVGVAQGGVGAVGGEQDQQQPSQQHPDG